MKKLISSIKRKVNWLNNDLQKKKIKKKGGEKNGKERRKKKVKKKGGEKNV